MNTRRIDRQILEAENRLRLVPVVDKIPNRWISVEAETMQIENEIRTLKLKRTQKLERIQARADWWDSWDF